MRPSRADRRSLPLFAAGEVALTYAIEGFEELIEHDTEWGEHSHPTHELLWNQRGASSVTVGSQTWMITPARGLWLPAGVVHRAAAPAGTWYRTAHFGVSMTAISDRPTAVDVTPLLRLLLDRLNEPTLAAPSRTLAEEMILDVLAPSPREQLVSVPAAPVLAPIVTAVLGDPGDPRGLADWAGQLGVSARTITRAFRAEVGLGFARWVATVRAQRAIALLVAGEDLDEIATALGYSSVSAFGAAFRRTTGVTPGGFRSQ